MNQPLLISCPLCGKPVHPMFFMNFMIVKCEYCPSDHMVMIYDHLSTTRPVACTKVPKMPQAIIQF